MFGRVFACFLVGLVVAASIIPGPTHVPAADTQCVIVKDYVETVKNLCIYRFGEDREKALLEARTKFLKELRQANPEVSPELEDLIGQYVTSCALGYDRMRKKGDASLVKKSQDLHDRIKALCPWD
ncbi:MAG: hypothetical protein RDU20_06370 [Desulfomonilaceae bacterium]|nr:hypothetical protein [Desulfomonilaceae bacterium]